jgi:hypothetical protein
MSLTRDPEKARAWRQRSKPLQRKTPMPRGTVGLRRTELARGSGLKRGKSARLRAREADLPAARDALRDRSGGVCEWPGCTEPATDPHHRCIADRERGVHDPDRMADLCAGHHRHVHANPKQSYRDGWLIRSNSIEEHPCPAP